MADYIKTISNSINIFGLNPSNKWGDSNGFAYTFVWGTTKWGEGSFSLVFSVEKLVENSIIPDTIIINESIKLITNDLTIQEDLSSEKLSQGEWSYVFPPNTIEGESRIFTSFTCGTVSTNTYTCQAAGSTTWS